MLAREYVKQMFSDTRDADQSGSQNRAKRVRETVSDCGSDRKPRPDVFRRNFLGSGRTPPASKVHGQTGKPSFRKTSESQEAMGCVYFVVLSTFARFRPLWPHPPHTAFDLPDG